MVFILSSSDPTTNESNVFINKEILLTFNKAVDESTLLDNTVSLQSVGGSVIDVTLSLNPLNTSEVKILPKVNLSANTQYRIILVGTGQTLFTPLAAEDGDLFQGTTIIVFTTGTSVYKIDTTLEKEAATLTLEGDLFLPTNVEALGYEFTINSVNPPNRAHGISTTLNGSNQLSFYFSKPLATGQDYSTWADVEVYPLLSKTSYLASGETFGAGTIPEYSIEASGQYLNVSFSGELPKNAGLYCRLTNSIRSISNDQYGGNLEYTSNTPLYPDIVGVHSIRREINSISAEVYDDYIGAVIAKNTVRLYFLLNSNLSKLDGWAAYHYVLNAVVLEIIEDKDLEKFIVAGTRRQLGNLNVSVDSLIGRIAMKAARAKKEMDDAKEALFPGWFIGTGTWKASMGTRLVERMWYDISSRYTDPVYKYYQADEPASNTALNRNAKSNNPAFYL